MYRANALATRYWYQRRVSIFIANHAFQIERTVVISQSSVVRHVADMERSNMRLPSLVAM